MLRLRSCCAGFPAAAKRRVRCVLFAAVALAGCAGDPLRDEANELLAAGRYEEALGTLKRGYDAHPERKVYRTDYLRQRDSVVTQLLAQAESVRLAGNLEAAGATSTGCTAVRKG